MDDCIFCKIIKGEIPSTKLYEDENILGFLDISPVNKGHALIIPKKHYETLTDIPKEELNKMTEIAQKIAKAVKEAVKPDGYNILMSNGKAAEQIIPHAHIHIIPRYDDDDFKMTWTHKEYAEGEIDSFKEKIAKNL